MHPSESAAQTPVRHNTTTLTTINENIVNPNPSQLPLPPQSVPMMPMPVLPKPQVPMPVLPQPQVQMPVQSAPIVQEPVVPQPKSSAVLQSSPDVEFIGNCTPTRAEVKHEPMDIDEVDGRFGPRSSTAVRKVNLNESFTALAKKRVGHLTEVVQGQFLNFFNFNYFFLTLIKV